MTKYRFGLTNNQLKAVAMLSMLSDHIGKEFFPDLLILQYIGRLALPIFAYMIAEGCLYTRNKKSYLLKIGLLAVGCQSVYFIFEHSLYQNILVTFTLSVILIFVIRNFLDKKDLPAVLLMCSVVLVVSVIVLFPYIVKNTGFLIDYGLFGVLLPVLVYFAKNKIMKLFATAFSLTMISFDLGGFQWISLFSVVLLWLYNGKRGKLNLKYFFYIFYPSHLAIIYAVKMLIDYFS